MGELVERFINEMDPTFEIVSQFIELNGNEMENLNLPLMVLYNNLPLIENTSPTVESPILKAEQSEEDKRKKAKATPESSSQSLVTPCLGNGLQEDDVKKKSSFGGGKRERRCLKEVEKPKEVVHVRARRGQATDSHSLAERVRRERINERMRWLQELVPGCYKEMGMAGMLDEIINYVQSLQNQVEFLSMKLSAASSFYDFNLDCDQPMAPPQLLL